ncbi:MAG: ABC transporter ATP-binding protein [Deltaproteobacteria bacterium]|nr:ABC transporter ATP-binding protein [Deltaproteobacteria bacterium]
MLLQIEGLNAGYGFIQILWNVSLSIDEGEYIGIIGPNGAGKSTIMKTISGLIKPNSGQIFFMGENIAGQPGNKVARKGLAYVTEEMNLFTNMSVQENLFLGAYILKDKHKKTKRLEFVYDVFPRMAERKLQLAGTMSGGERKMLAIARGLMSDPKILLVDEPSFGLAPQTTEDVFRALDQLNKAGMTILVVEQNVSKTLSVTKRCYVLENGKIELQGLSCDLAGNSHVRKIFLGI